VFESSLRTISGSYQCRTCTPGGGGGAAAAATVTMPEASLAVHGRKRANMGESEPVPAETRMQRCSPWRTTSGSPPSARQCVVTSPSEVSGDAAQKALTPLLRAKATMLMASKVDRG
jgi:hypothetical protein